MAERITRCPQCGKSCRASKENSWRPFCSERCKLMDLGDWLDERFRIPAHDQDKLLDPDSNDQN